MRGRGTGARGGAGAELERRPRAAGAVGARGALREARPGVSTWALGGHLGQLLVPCGDEGAAPLKRSRGGPRALGPAGPPLRETTSQLHCDR